MSYTQTPNYALYKPTINSDNDQWGTHLNANADTIDTQLKTIANTAGVISFNTRTGAVSLLNADVTTVLPPSSTTPVMDGTAAVGTGTTWARADHVHPTDTGIAAAATAAQNNVGRNLLHNPLFNVAQRGAGPFTAAAVYNADRWGQYFVNGTLSTTVSPASDANRAAIGDEAATSLLVPVVAGSATAGSYAVLYHRLESVRRLGGKTVTLSFWAWTGSGTLNVGASLDQSFGTGGSPSASVIGAVQVVSINATPARYSLTFAMASTAGKTLGTTAGTDTTGLNLFLSSATGGSAPAVGVQSGTIAFWGVQLEVGTVATPLEKPDPRYDLSNCQRFYQTQNFTIGFPAYVSGATQRIIIPFIQTMRATPTVTVAPGTLTSASAPTLAVAFQTGAWVQTAATAAGGFVEAQGSFTAAADL